MLERKKGCLRSVFVFRESRLLPNRHHVTQVWLQSSDFGHGCDSFGRNPQFFHLHLFILFS
jgi:hypothetical protein